MIDVDRFEEQLDLALTDELRTAIGLAPTAAPPQPAPPPTPARPARAAPRSLTRHQKAPRPARVTSTRAMVTTAAPAAAPPLAADIPSLLRAGRIADADRLIGEASAASDHSGDVLARRDAAVWVTMKALRDGRIEDARAGTLSVRELSQEAGDRDTADHFWGQRFWVVLDWGNETERYELLDLCRERAYGRNDLYWRARLALLCARMGRNDEAGRELDASVIQLDAAKHAQDPDAYAVASDLVEAAAVLRDPARARVLQRSLLTAVTPVVFDSRSGVCKGASARYQALASAASWRWDECDNAFRLALDVNRAMGALPLVARTMSDWGATLTDRGDPRAWDCLRESSELARHLGMTGLIAGMP